MEILIFSGVLAAVGAIAVGCAWLGERNFQRWSAKQSRKVNALIACLRLTAAHDAAMKLPDDKERAQWLAQIDEQWQIWHPLTNSSKRKEQHESRSMRAMRRAQAAPDR